MDRSAGVTVGAYALDALDVVSAKTIFTRGALRVHYVELR